MTAASATADVLPRSEDARFLTGAGRYLDDVMLDSMVHGVLVRSPHAHARILSIDTHAALEVPGVLRQTAIVTMFFEDEILAYFTGDLAPSEFLQNRHAYPVEFVFQFMVLLQLQ